MAGRSRLKGGLFKYSKLDHRQMETILRSFARDEPATNACRRVGVDIRSINRLYQMLRERLCLCGYDDLGLTWEETYRNLTSEDYALYELARRRRARGWLGKYSDLHVEESEHRYLRLRYAPQSTFKVLKQSLTLHPLGSIRIDEPWTYVQLDNRHRKRLAKPRLTLEEWLSTPLERKFPR